MSGAGQPPASPPVGPYQARIQQIWNDIWRAEANGEVFEAFVVLAESELARFAANLPPANPSASLDLQLAQNVNLFQSRHFAARLASIQNYRDQIQDIGHLVYDQMIKFNEHAVKSITLAHGGIVIAALAYIQTKESVPVGMVEVIGLCSFGYLLTVLASHLVAALSAPITNILMVLRTPRLAEAVRNKNISDLAKANKRMMWFSLPVFYLSVVCLIVALVVGVRSLVFERGGIPAAPSGKAYKLL